jgi:hypothetical protein
MKWTEKYSTYKNYRRNEDILDKELKESVVPNISIRSYSTLQDASKLIQKHKQPKNE